MSVIGGKADIILEKADISTLTKCAVCDSGASKKVDVTNRAMSLDAATGVCLAALAVAQPGKGPRVPLSGRFNYACPRIFAVKQMFYGLTATTGAFAS